MRIQRLSQTQIDRIYQVYEFSDIEEIEDAYFEDGVFHIIYRDADGLSGDYIPNISEPEDREKLHSILKGDDDGYSEN